MLRKVSFQASTWPEASPDHESVLPSEMPPLPAAAPCTIDRVDANVLKGTGVQLLSLQSAVGVVFLSYFLAPFWYVVGPWSLTVPSA